MRLVMSGQLAARLAWGLGVALATLSPAHAQEKPEVKKYEDVITADAVTDDGVFKVHRVGDKLYFEIPDSLLDRDMYMVSRQAKVPSGAGDGGGSVAEQLIRWQKQGNKIFIRRLTYSNVADTNLPIARSVESNNYAPIVESFAIVTTPAAGGASVIDVTKLFMSDRQWIGPRGGGFDPERSYINYAHSYPLNISVRHTATYGSGADSKTYEMHQSIVLLPREPMRGRYFDERVGFFTTQHTNFGLDQQKAATETFINRWRLEPKDPAAYARGELVEPVKPIVYYVDPATPKKWAPYVKQGIEDWQRAFEAAGFKNAIIGKYAPTAAEDPEYNPEDVRFSTVRWVASMTRNAMGPSVVDPRSGEIIEADVLWYHNHLRSYRNRLLIETGAANPGAQTIDIPDEMLGEAVRQVIAHEVGHTLGLPHNMGASWAYPVDSLRSPSFTEKYGVAPSVMEYARQNYIAQPGDGVRRFIRKIGPYDLYSINWGYRLLPDAATPEAEKPVLRRWIAEKSNDPMYRFADSYLDPRDQTEDLGDDPVRASSYAIANLKRVVPNLIKWTTKPGQDYTDLNEIYTELVQQWGRYIGHVEGLIGGVYETARVGGENKPVFEPVPGSKQRAAVKFLNENVFDTPMFLLDPEILKLIEGTGTMDRMRGLQSQALSSVLEPGRLNRLLECEVFHPGAGYPVPELLRDVKAGVWSELSTGKPIDAFRRALQRVYVDRIEALYSGPSSAQSDLRLMARQHLEELRAEVALGAGRSTDRMTQQHLEDIVQRIDRILGTGR